MYEVRCETSARKAQNKGEEGSDGMIETKLCILLAPCKQHLNIFAILKRMPETKKERKKKKSRANKAVPGDFSFPAPASDGKKVLALFTFLTAPH